MRGSRRRYFFCFLHAIAWFPSAKSAHGTIGTEDTEFTECLSPGLSVMTKSRTAPSIHGNDHTLIRKGYRRKQLTARGPEHARGARGSGVIA